jgi:hypothetical protein
MIITPERHLQLRLVTSPRVARIVGFNIYPIAVPNGIDFPFVLFKRANISRESVLTNTGQLYAPVVSLQFSCWHTGYDDARELADEVRLAIDGRTGTLANATIQDIRLTSEVDDFLDPIMQGANLPPAYEVRQLYHVRWQEAVG